MGQEPRFVCDSCGSSNIHYQEQLTGNIWPNKANTYPRRSRTAWIVFCDDCLQHVSAAAKDAIAAHLFEASEDGRRAEAVRAAAPDLLAACEMAMGILTELDNDAANMHEVCDTIAAARAAIAKATP